MSIDWEKIHFTVVLFQTHALYRENRSQAIFKYWQCQYP